MALKESLIGFGATTEAVEGKLVGRVILKNAGDFVQNQEAMEIRQILAADQRLQEIIANKLHWNTGSLRGLALGVERGASAYYSWNPQDSCVIIEWGEIDLDNSAKLHDYLNKSIDYFDRNKRGMTIRSGHISRFKSTGTIVCLLDSTFQAEPIIDTLNSYGFVVVDTSGYVQEPKLGGDFK